MSDFGSGRGSGGCGRFLASFGPVNRSSDNDSRHVTCQIVEPSCTLCGFLGKKQGGTNLKVEIDCNWF